MTEPLVSICIPTYNGAHYLKECLDSCLRQTFADYEILVCDDGSSDATPEIIENYARQHAKIRFVRNEHNLGLVGNWNKCLELAKGEWIKFVFQDDYLFENCLAEFVKCIQPELNLMVCDRNFILPENATAAEVHYYSTEVRTLENTTSYKGNIYSAALISKIAVQNICMNFIGEPSLAFFRKKIVNEIGAFNPALKQICDLEFLLREASQNGLYYLPEKLCAFRIHAGSTTSSNTTHKYFELHYIEPLLFSWILLYDARFATFRAQLSFAEKLKLNTYFRFKCYRAYKEAPDYYLFKDNRPAFKEIFTYRKGNLLLKLLRLIRK